MNSPELAPQHIVRLPQSAVTPAAVPVPRQAHAGTAANDDAADADLQFTQNPLWVMAIALGVFCAFAAFVMAFG